MRVNWHTAKNSLLSFFISPDGNCKFQNYKAIHWSANTIRFKIHSAFFTDRVHSTTEGYVLTRVCPSVCPHLEGEAPSQVQAGGYPAGGVPCRRVPGQVQMGGGYLGRVPLWPGPAGGGTWPGPDRGYLGRVPSSQVLMGRGTWPGPDGVTLAGYPPGQVQMGGALAGYPLLARSKMGGTLAGYPLAGYPPKPGPDGGTLVGQQKEYLLHGGWYASCVHAEGLSCFLFCFRFFS